MDQELLTYLERQFHETHQRLEAQVGSLHQGLGALREEVGTLREETRQRFERVDEQIRHLHVLVEGGREETRLLAEGMMGFNHIMERTEREVNLKLDELRTLVTPLYRRIDERVTHLEEREGQKTRDVMDLIRERFAMPRTV